MKTPKTGWTRKLPDLILIAFHHACDDGDLDTARPLLGVLEDLLKNRRKLDSSYIRRKNCEALVASHERLWHLRQEAAEMKRIGLRAVAA